MRASVESIPIFLPVYVRVCGACIPAFIAVHFRTWPCFLPVHAHLQSVRGVFTSIFTSAFKSFNLLFTSACPHSDYVGNVYLYFYQCTSEFVVRVYLYFYQCISECAPYFYQCMSTFSLPFSSLLWWAHYALRSVNIDSLETQGVSSHRVGSKQRVGGKSSLIKFYWAIVWS